MLALRALRCFATKRATFRYKYAVMTWTNIRYVAHVVAHESVALLQHRCQAVTWLLHYKLL